MFTISRPSSQDPPVPDIVLALDDWIITHHKLQSVCTYNSIHTTTVDYLSLSSKVQKGKRLDTPWFRMIFTPKDNELTIHEQASLPWKGLISDPDFMEGFTKIVHERVIRYQAKLLVKKLSDIATGLIVTAEFSKIEGYIQKIKECTTVLVHCNEAKFKTPRKKHKK